MTPADFLNNLISRYPVLKFNQHGISNAFDLLKTCYENNNKLLIAGNGGSFADAQHITGELMKNFCVKRKLNSSLINNLTAIDPVIGKDLADTLEQPLTAIPLGSFGALDTAYLNDTGTKIFAQNLLGLGRSGDILLAISTSGNSKNIIEAVITAKAMNLKVIALTGKTGGKLAALADILINVQEIETYKIQELHLPVYHCICLMLENYFFA